MARDTKAELAAVNTILWEDWDPIGCGVPEDEYATYAATVYGMRIDGAPRDEIAAYLRRVATDSMGMASPEGRLAIALEKLMALPIARGAS